VRIHFEIDFFISEDSSAAGWFKANKEHWKAALVPTNFFIESDTLDFEDPAV